MAGTVCSADSRMTLHVQTTNASEHRVWDGIILVAIKSITSRAFPREIRVHGRFFVRRFQPLSVGGIFSNRQQSISWCSGKSPFP